MKFSMTGQKRQLFFNTGDCMGRLNCIILEIWNQVFVTKYVILLFNIRVIVSMIIYCEQKKPEIIFWS